MKRFFLIFCLALSCLASGPAQGAERFTVPSLNAPVTDLAGALSDQARDGLDQALKALWDQGGSQVAVLIVPDLGGLAIEQASMKVAEAWKLGTKEKDNGVLLLIAMQERKLRLEVGQGLEGVLTDAQSRRIIDEQMVPLIRAGRFDDAVLVGIYAVTRLTDPAFDLKTYFEGVDRMAPGGPRTLPSGGAFPVVFLVILIFVLLSSGGRGLLWFMLGAFIGRGGRGGFGSGGGFSGGFGGGGGFSGGGGGFSGGGGGFSGGGASGGW